MLTEKAITTIKNSRLVDKNDRIVVGASGGPDSTALIFLLNSLKKEFGLVLHIAHLDHMLRADSYKDKEFVELIAAKLKLPVSFGRVDIKKSAKKGSLEEAARNARFEFFFKTAKSIKANKIALGHTLDDQAETVLMRILRGAGLCGLAGILPKRKMGGFEIIRPLVELRRKDIEAYLRKKRIKPRVDSTNAQDIYFRNKIRNKLLPLLENNYNKNIKEVLANLAQNAGSDYDCLQQIAEKRSGYNRAKIDLDKLAKLHPAIRRLLIRQAIASVAGSTRRITFQHMLEIEDLVSNRPKGSVVDLPKGISVIKKNSLFFYQKNQ